MGKARLLRAIISARKAGSSAHIRAHWASRLTKYKHLRAKLYRKLIHHNMDLAKKVRTERKRFIKTQRMLAKEVEEVKRIHVLEHVSKRIEHFLLHLKKEKTQTLEREAQNSVLIRRLAEQKSTTLAKLQRERENHAVIANRLHTEIMTFMNEFEKNERDIARLKLMKKRLLKIMIGRRRKSENYATHTRSAQVNFRNQAIHRRELSAALRIMKKTLWEMAIKAKQQRRKTKEAGNRAAILTRGKMQSSSLSRQVQEIHAGLVAELRRRRRERARLMVRRRILHAVLVKKHLKRRAIAAKIQRIQSLMHVLERMKGRRTTYIKASRRMRTKAMDEIHKIHLAKLNLIRKLWRVEKRVQHKMREFQSGNYKTMKSLQKLEKWKSITSHKWTKVLRDEKRELEHQVRRKEKSAAALRSAMRRSANMMRNVARHKINLVRAGHNLRIQRRLFDKEKTDLQGLKKVRVKYLQKLQRLRNEQLKGLGLLRQKQFTSSRKLHHAVEERVQQLRKAKVWRKRQAEMLVRVHAQLKQQRERAENEGGLSFRGVKLSVDHAFRKAAVEQSHLVLELQHVWSKLQKAVKLNKRKMTDNLRLARLRERERTHTLGQQTMRLIKLLSKEEQRTKVALKRHEFWKSMVLNKWREKVANKLRAAHKVVKKIKSEIKRAQSKESGVKMGMDRYGKCC